MKTSRQWKEFYRRERESLGEERLLHLLETATPVRVPECGALIFPHTRLDVTGDLVAAVARAVVESGREEVLALGVLHGGREEDAPLVAAARAGDPAARAALRRVHGPDVPGDRGLWAEEFSLDGFCALLDLAALNAGHSRPRVHLRYPFLVGDDPHSLPGLDELRGVIDRGAALVATADPIHHGVGYGTPVEVRRRADDIRALPLARESVERGLGFLARSDFTAFASHCTSERSDFRDAGPVLAALLSPHGEPLTAHVLDLRLVDYSEVLGAAPPTWVAGGLAALSI